MTKSKGGCMAKNEKKKEAKAMKLRLTAAQYDAISNYKSDAISLLASGMDANTTARCERRGFAPAPLWLAVLDDQEPQAQLEALLSAGCRFEGVGEEGAFIGSACAHVSLDMARWYVDQALAGIMPKPRDDEQSEALWRALGQQAESSPDDFDTRRAGQSLGSALSVLIKSFNGDGPPKGKLDIQDSSKGAWAQRCALLAMDIQKMAGHIPAQMVADSALRALSDAQLAMFASVGLLPEQAKRAGELIVQRANAPGRQDSFMRGKMGVHRHAREEWESATKKGAELGRLGVQVDLAGAARTGSPLFVALALGGGACAKAGRQELAMFMSKLASTHDGSDFLEAALAPILGGVSKPGMSMLAVEALAAQGCSFIKAPVLSERSKGEGTAEAGAKKCMRKNRSDGPLGLAAQSSAQSLATALGIVPVASKDAGLPSSMGDLAKIVLSLAEREHLLRATKASKAPSPQRSRI
jgi:hypothetical protein